MLLDFPIFLFSYPWVFLSSLSCNIRFFLTFSLRNHWISPSAKQSTGLFRYRVFFRLSSSNPSRRSDATPSRAFPRQSKKSLDRCTNWLNQWFPMAFILHYYITPLTATQGLSNCETCAKTLTSFPKYGTLYVVVCGEHFESPCMRHKTHYRVGYVVQPWRVVRVVEGARLESVCTANTVPRVRISHSPPWYFGALPGNALL